MLEEFGIEAVGAIMDPLPSLALDDAVRAFQPDEVLLSALYETRFGLTRKDLVEWAKATIEVPVTHIPVRIDDDAIRWDVIHTLVVGTQTVNSPDLVERLKRAPPRSRTATRSSARARATSAARRSASGSPRRWPSSTASRSTPPASR